ncbi:MAG: hypothetical protein AAF152_13615 [Cyanobacteria bacterium P01_A01_bin.114]
MTYQTQSPNRTQKDEVKVAVLSDEMQVSERQSDWQILVGATLIGLSALAALWVG